MCLKSIVLASLAIAWSGAAVADELVSKQDILELLLGSVPLHREEAATSGRPADGHLRLQLGGADQARRAAARHSGKRRQGDRLAQEVLTIEGHTDASGANPTIRTSPERRAASAKDYLVAGVGIDPVHLNTIGFGKSRPLPDKPELAPEQRRIEVVVGTVE